MAISDGLVVTPSRMPRRRAPRSPSGCRCRQTVSSLYSLRRVRLLSRRLFDAFRLGARCWAPAAAMSTAMHRVDVPGAGRHGRVGELRLEHGRGVERQQCGIARGPAQDQVAPDVRVRLGSQIRLMAPSPDHRGEARRRLGRERRPPASRSAAPSARSRPRRARCRAPRARRSTARDRTRPRPRMSTRRPAPCVSGRGITTVPAADRRAAAAAAQRIRRQLAIDVVARRPRRQRQSDAPRTAAARPHRTAPRAAARCRAGTRAARPPAPTTASTAVRGVCDLAGRAARRAPRSAAAPPACSGGPGRPRSLKATAM